MGFVAQGRSSYFGSQVSRIFTAEASDVKDVIVPGDRGQRDRIRLQPDEAIGQRNRCSEPRAVEWRIVELSLVLKRLILRTLGRPVHARKQSSMRGESERQH